MLRDQIRPFIPKIVTREMTNRELARLLDVSEFAICRALKALKVQREPGPFNKADTKAAKDLRETRKAYRQHVASTMSIKDAAAAAGCSTRTIYRLRNK